MKNKIHSLIVEGIVFCGSGLVLLSYSLSSYAKGFNEKLGTVPVPVSADRGDRHDRSVLMDRRRGSYGDAKRLPQIRMTRAGKKAGKTEKRRWVVIALILCAIYYAALAFIENSVYHHRKFYLLRIHFRHLRL